MAQPTEGSLRSGILFGLVAYVWWGLVPLYFREVKQVSAGEILAHRIVWTIGLLVVLTTLLGGWSELIRVLRSRRLVLALLLSAAFLATNWLLYIYATVTSRVAEASLGYYMMPLVNAFLATVFLGEKLRPAHYPALALVALGVAVPFIAAGSVAWLAVALTVSFGLYGLVRKQVQVDSFTGLAVETLLMFVPSAAYLLGNETHGGGAFGPDWRLNSLLMFSGVVTLVPLLAFTVSIRRMPLLANSFIQFVSPTMQLLVAVFVIGEEIQPDRMIAMGCVWAAVAIFVADAVWRARAKHGDKPVEVEEDEPVGELVASQ
ncbi:EamA family transporter RarD [Fimbriiglobus ruber]|uniref:Protein rarD n=1 Tax=Fimbriiglobus ruber TaxID=1908690 RepID=A0A225DJF6_9BACT|nr:EamA family transporter RarD [Fimbriiglobus ruber]OWK36525.1 Protein rarD [Fimbriiglobus ruber]